MKTDLIKKKYLRDGYVVVKKVFSEELVNKAKLNLEEFINTNKNKYTKKQIHFANGENVNSIHNFKDWPWIDVFKKNRSIKIIVEELLGKKNKDFGSELFAKPPKVGLAAPVHQDNYYWCIDNANALTVWIALNDTNEKNGGIYYYKKSHKIGVLEHKSSFAPGSSQTIKYLDGMNVFEVDLPKLKAGDCLIHHCLVAHGSKPNKSNQARVGCTLRYISKDSKIDKFMQQKYKKSLEKHFKKLNN
jgi:phytanoyl-CoA hydroxylase